MVVGCAEIAPLGEHLDGVDLTRPWQRREDRPVRVLPESGDYREVQGLAGAVQGVRTATIASTASRTATVNVSSTVPGGAARSRASSSAGVRPPEYPCLTTKWRAASQRDGGRRQRSGSGRGTPTRSGFDVGENNFPAGPMRIKQRGELIRHRHPHVNQVIPGAAHGSQSRVSRVAAEVQAMCPQPQVLGDHQGVAGVGFRPGQHLPFPPGLDRVRADRHHRKPGLEQRVDQRPSGRSIRPAIAGVAGQPTLSNRRSRSANPWPLCGRSRIAGFDPTGRIQHAHGVCFGGPIQYRHRINASGTGIRALLTVAATTRRGGRLPGGH